MNSKLLLFVGALCFSALIWAPAKATNQNTFSDHNPNSDRKMKVEIWSDVMCPFCYIGKRKFEKALNQFADKNQIELEWKSFQLSPDLKTNTEISVHEFLATHKGMSMEQAKGMNDQVTQMAAQEGLVYDFDRAVVANSFNAHRFAHYAKTQGKQDDAEELLFRAYFTDGKNIDDYETLIALGKSIGLNTAGVREALESGKFADAVHSDIREATEIGVSGVPFFVFNRKYAVSGAQPVEVFSETLKKSFEEWQVENPKPKLNVVEGNVCKPDGSCD